MTPNIPIPFELPGFAIDQVDEHENLLIVRAHSTATAGVCPTCAHSSSQIHSHYIRSPGDLPSSGRQVRLVLTVPRFRCPDHACSKRTFVERIPQVAPVYGQRTRRLTITLQAIACELSAEAGKRVTQVLKMAVSGDTLLRLLRNIAVGPFPTPRVLGVDDWAMKKGHRYGTILVDLEQQHVVDLLPDREADTLTAWLQAHPGIEIICRDRASDYAKAASAGAPQAIQIADRWHLLKNLGEALQRMLNGQTKVLRLAAKQAEEASDPSITRATSAETVPPLEPLELPPQSESAARRQLLFDEANHLSAQGYSKRAIARQLHINRATVDHYLRVDRLPHRQPPRQVSKVAPYHAYVLKRIGEDGCSIHQVWQELQSQGFSGRYASVRRLVQRFRPGDARRLRRTQAEATPRPLSPRQAMWLLVRETEQLTPEQLRYRDMLCSLSPEIALAYRLAQRYVLMFKTRQVDELDLWLQDAQTSPVPALRHFATTMQRDYDAVKASLTFAWSSGQVEGQVNRLKVIKRIMYGRAKFDLLRLRVLQPP